MRRKGLPTATTSNFDRVMAVLKTKRSHKLFVLLTGIPSSSVGSVVEIKIAGNSLPIEVHECRIEKGHTHFCIYTLNEISQQYFNITVNFDVFYFTSQ